jgi:hypothetical protein
MTIYTQLWTLTERFFFFAFFPRFIFSHFYKGSFFEKIVQIHVIFVINPYQNTALKSFQLTFSPLLPISNIISTKIIFN